jgi:hypothetical protein
MMPVRVVPAMTPASTDSSKSISATEQDDQWHSNHAHQIAAYNAWAEQRPTFSESVRLWREAEQGQQSAA